MARTIKRKMGKTRQHNLAERLYHVFCELAHHKDVTAVLTLIREKNENDPSHQATLGYKDLHGEQEKEEVESMIYYFECRETGDDPYGGRA